MPARSLQHRGRVCVAAVRRARSRIRLGRQRAPSASVAAIALRVQRARRHARQAATATRLGEHPRHSAPTVLQAARARWGRLRRRSAPPARLWHRAAPASVATVRRARSRTSWVRQRARCAKRAGTALQVHPSPRRARQGAIAAVRVSLQRRPAAYARRAATVSWEAQRPQHAAQARMQLRVACRSARNALRARTRTRRAIPGVLCARWAGIVQQAQ